MPCVSNQRLARRQSPHQGVTYITIERPGLNDSCAMLDIYLSPCAFYIRDAAHTLASPARCRTPLRTSSQEVATRARNAQPRIRQSMLNTFELSRSNWACRHRDCVSAKV